MADQAIYFPYITVPDSAWLTRTLLYWDTVRAMVPSEYANAPSRLAPHMRELTAAGLVQPVVPAGLVHRLPEFEERFLVHVHRRGQNPRASSFPPVRLHVEKLGGLVRELQGMGLLRPADYPWYYAEPWLARAFMAYLSGRLASLPEIDADPVTNERASFRVLGGESSSAKQMRSHTRTVVLRKILPVPTSPVSITELADFKERHEQHIRAFRSSVEMRCIELANIEDCETRKEMALLVASELSEEIDTIADAMRRRWTRVIYCGLLPIMSSGTGLLGGGGVGGVAAGVTGLVAATFSGIETMREHKEVMRRPLAYGALVRRAFPHMEAA